MRPEIQKLVTIRDLEPGDVNFILATFKRGVYYGDKRFTNVPKDVFMDNYRDIADEMLRTSVVKVACLIEDPNVIVGYSILSEDYLTIRFVYVKSKWRLAGIGRSLVPQFPLAVSYMTDIGAKLLSKFPNCIFNPF